MVRLHATHPASEMYRGASVTSLPALRQLGSPAILSRGGCQLTDRRGTPFSTDREPDMCLVSPPCLIRPSQPQMAHSVVCDSTHDRLLGPNGLLRRTIYLAALQIAANVDIQFGELNHWGCVTSLTAGCRCFATDLVG
jgi:hypothetical protein